MTRPRIVTELPGPRAREWIEREKQSVSPSFGRPYPLVATQGSGVSVEDVDGNTFLDFSAGIAVCATGHCHPEVVSAIKEQAERLIHMSGTDFYYPEQILMAEEIARITPGACSKRVFFGNSGTEAVEAGFKLARYHTRRPRMLAYVGAFHGRTFGSLSLTASSEKYRRGFAPLVPGVTHVPYPYCYRCPFHMDPADCDTYCVTHIEEQVLGRYVPPSEVAAIIAEPIQGEGGYVVPPEGYFQRIKAMCEEYGFLFICDEVQSGFGRTGKMFAIEHWGVEPDILCMAKGIASGMPLGACCASSSIMDWHQGAHASTFGANPVSCRASLATIRLLEEGLIDAAAQRGAQLKRGLEELAEETDIIGDVRGKGLMIGVEFVQGPRCEAAPELSRDVINACFRAGIALLPCGKSTIRFCPPLVVSEEECDTALAVFAQAVRSVR